MDIILILSQPDARNMGLGCNHPADQKNMGKLLSEGTIGEKDVIIDLKLIC